MSALSHLTGSFNVTKQKIIIYIYIYIYILGEIKYIG